MLSKNDIESLNKQVKEMKIVINKTLSPRDSVVYCVRELASSIAKDYHVILGILEEAKLGYRDLTKKIISDSMKRFEKNFDDDYDDEFFEDIIDDIDNKSIS